MANILPFRGIFYNKEKIKDLSRVLAPPYDIISTEARERYYEKSEYNVIRLILGKDFSGDDETNNKYTRAAGFFHKWLEEGILVRDNSASIYFLEQEYELKSEVFGAVAGYGARTDAIKRRGFIGLARLENFSKGIIRPHEETMPEPKRDRLNLLRACAANFSQVFTAYEGSPSIIDSLWQEMRRGIPIFDLIDGENIGHRLWKVNDQKSVNLIVEAMKDKKLFIADGHHRYESALEYRNQLRKANPKHRGNESYNYVMAYFLNMEDRGLKILPIHRALRNFAGFDRKRLIAESRKNFGLKRLSHLEKLLGAMQDEEKEHRIGMYAGGDEFYLLTLQERKIAEELARGRGKVSCRLDVVILHTLIIERILGIPPENQENITYSEKINEVLAKVRDGSHCLAFFLRPVKLSEFKAIVEAGEIMPKKSTYFYPKLLSGLVINKIEM